MSATSVELSAISDVKRLIMLREGETNECNKRRNVNDVKRQTCHYGGAGGEGGGKNKYVQQAQSCQPRQTSNVSLWWGAGGEKKQMSATDVKLSTMSGVKRFIMVGRWGAKTNK